ncbi:hypothetical protein [Nonomuraea sp. SBT364]|uniref:hypothetical protein n=1 Tax=Nonomuraea sp. SBT364 TaxID=1580530 RepID=UPI00066C265B|nr:hypothetical protein [Nonomuraea sp. SBT364]
MRVHRLVPVAAAARLASLSFASPAQAAGSHACFFGEPGSQEGALNAWSCTGAGYVDVAVSVFSGAAAGDYVCRTAFSWNGTLSATGCAEAP